MKLTLFFASFIFLFTTIWAGHVPPPPPVPPSFDESISSQRQSGILPVYPVTGAQGTPLESLVDTGQAKYNVGEATYAWPWVNQEDTHFLLPKVETKISRQAISLNKKAFKNYSSVNRESFQKVGLVILPLLLTHLQMPSFPEGYGDIDEVDLKLKQSQVNSSKKARQQAFKLLVSLPGELEDPYRYLGLVDLDAQIANQALVSFETQKPQLGPLLLLAAGHNSEPLMNLVKRLLSDHRDGQSRFAKIKAVQKASEQDQIIKILSTSKKLSPEALFVALEKLSIPSVRGDETKKEKKKIQSQLKKIEKTLNPHFTKYKKPDSTFDELRILLLSTQAKLGEKKVLGSLLEFSEDQRWWIRLLVSRSLKDFWGERQKTTPLLLERQRDWFYEVRREANESLQWLHRVPIVMNEYPDLVNESFTIDLWEKWWLEHQEVSGLFNEKGWVSIEMKLDEGNVYSPTGLVKHSYLKGTYKKYKLFLIDHNDNERFDDYGLDNFAVGDLKKPGTFLSHLVKLDDKFYFMRLKPEEFVLQIKPYKGPLGTLKVKESFAKDMRLGFLVIGKSPDLTLQIDRNAKGEIEPQLIPAGHYHVYAGHVRREKGSAESNYIAHIAPGRNRLFEVVEGQEVQIDLGQELTVDVKVDFVGDKEDQKSLELKNPSIYGRYDELYFAIDPEIDQFEVSFEDLSGELIKKIQWKAELDVKDPTRVAQLLFTRTQLNGTINALRNAIANKERQIELKQIPPFRLDTVKAILQRQKVGLIDYSNRLGEVEIELSKLQDSDSYQFKPLNVPLDKFPQDFVIRINGKVFFGEIKSWGIQISRNQNR